MLEEKTKKKGFVGKPLPKNRTMSSNDYRVQLVSPFERKLSIFK